MTFLTLTLDLPLHPGDLRAFRSCLSELAGREHLLFHNHRTTATPDGYRWEYPLIQYGVRKGRAVVCGIGAGAVAIRQYLLPQLPGTLHFAGKAHPLPAYQVREEKIRLSSQQPSRCYGLRGWLALSHDNYRLWKKAARQEDRRQILNRALTGHFRSLAQALGHPAPKSLAGEVLRVDQQKKVHWKEVPLLSFHCLIRSPLDLPPGLHLGRLAAFGFGQIMSREGYDRFSKKLAVGRQKNRWLLHHLPFD